MSSVTSEHGHSPSGESARPGSLPRIRIPGWAPWLVMGFYLAAAYALTWRLWADPGARMVGGNPGDANLVAWFMRYSATAVSHGRFPALVTTGLNAPQGINLMWNASMLLPGVILTPVTLLAGPWTSLNILLTLGFAGSAASLFWVLRWWGASITAAAMGGLVYGFSPALVTASMGHFQLQFAVLPPLIIHALLRIVTGRGSALWAGVRLGLLTAAQLFIGEELLVDTAVAAAVIIAVLALGQPRSAIEAIRRHARTAAVGLGAAVAVVVLTCGYALWVQFRGPLASHGSPWQVSGFHNYLYAFVTPSGALLFHTSSSAAAAASYPEPLPEYLAYLGWPLLVVAIVAAVRFWRDPKVRLTAVTFALLELFSLGAAAVTFHGITYPGALLPWHWLQGLPVLADALPDRLSILADGAVAALLAFALDRARGLTSLSSPSSPSGVTVRGRAWGLGGYVAAGVVVLAILPLVPLPLPAANVGQTPAGWQEAFARLQLASDAHVLVIPDERYGMGWQAETGIPGSMVGGGATIEPNRSGQATSYIYNRRPTAKYLASLYLGLPDGREPSRAQLRADLAYWHLAAIVAVTTWNTRLGRYLAAEFGPPTIQVGDMLVWRQPVLHASPGRLTPLHGGKGRACLAWRRSSSPAEPGSSARTFANGCWPTAAR